MMDTRTRSAPPYSCYYGYYRPCGVPDYTKYFFWTPRSESVTSYRGKRHYIQVGKKKRKKFHAFTRTLYDRSPLKQTGYWCPSSTKRVWGENWAATYFLSLMPRYPDTTNQYVAYGSPCPWVYHAMSAHSLEIRESVINDLFVKAKSPVFDGAVFIAELEETLTSVYDIFKGALKGLAKPSTRTKAGLKHIFLNPEEMWLWYRYFLLPAILDASSIIEALKPQEAIDRIQSGDRTDGYQKVSGHIGFYTPGIPQFAFPCEWEQEFKYGAGAAIDLYRRFDPSPYGTSAVDVLRATWERIPWSFVFDWFVHFGDWLTSLRDVEMEIAQSYVTCAIDCVTRVSFPEHYHDVEVFTFHDYRMDRFVDIEPPSFPLIDKKWANCTRLVDAISLITGMLKRILRRH